MTSLLLVRDRAPTYYLSAFDTSMSWYILSPSGLSKGTTLHKLAGRVYYNKDIFVSMYVAAKA